MVEIGEQVPVVCLSPIMNAIDILLIVKDGVIVRLSSKEVSRVLAELHVLSKGVIIELISSFKNIRLLNFCGFIDSQKIFNSEKSRLRYFQCMCTVVQKVPEEGHKWAKAWWENATCTCM